MEAEAADPGEGHVAVRRHHDLERVRVEVEREVALDVDEAGDHDMAVEEEVEPGSDRDVARLDRAVAVRLEAVVRRS